MIKRKIKKYGGSHCVHLTQNDLKRMKIKIDDVVNIEKMKTLSNNEFRVCEKCFKKFNIDDLDMVEGLWVCRKCEEEI